METTFVKQSPELRERSTNWLNSKTRDVDAGIEILKQVNYKPHVVKIFEANKNRNDIPAKVVQEIRNYLRYFANPANDIHLDILSPEEKKLLVQDQEFFTNIEKELQNEEYPAIIKRLLTIYSGSYKGRSMAHNDLKAVGEGNSAEECAKRKSILQFINSQSLRQDALWAAFESFKADGILPTEELLETVFVASTEEKTTNTNTDLILADDIEGLKKQSENWRTKLVKAENKLNFGTEKKADKLNPMPEGPKRIKQVKRVEQLKNEKIAIDTALANMK